MPYDPARALQLLRLGTQNPTAVFRYGQEAAIEHVVEGRGRILVVQKTGWGKSSVYFIATKLLREEGRGPAILISPLISLMRNQILAANRIGVKALTIHAGNTEEWATVETALLQNDVDILLISPERLANEHFRNAILPHIGDRISLLVVDEAHCISDWGHDFRPHYRLLERIIRALPANLRLLATTATANNRVIDDLNIVLGPNLRVSRGDLSRPSLLLQSITLPTQAERLAWLATHLPTIQGSGIIYTLLVRDAEEVAEWLRSRNITSAAYTGQTGDDREPLEDALLRNEIKVLVATTALGMGFDKPDLAFVIHYQTPGSVVAYYQQVGRAGRGQLAYGVLLSGLEEVEITDHFIESAFPSREEAKSVLDELLAAPEGLSIYELMNRVNASKGRIEKALALMSLESPAPIVRDGPKWVLTTAGLNNSFWSRADRLTQLRRAEQQQMQDYVRLASGHMDFLIASLDGNPCPTPQPNLPPLPSEADPVLIEEAIRFLRRTSLSIEPRKMWPPGGLPEMEVQGRIAAERQAQIGKALCVWGDAGWGPEVRRGKYIDERFSDELVAASVALIEQWAIDPFPESVTCVPSSHHPNIIPDFAQRLAAALGIPFQLTLEKVDGRPEQKMMANSSQQARNVDGALTLANLPLQSGPVLLVDDVVKSRWTFTIATYLLTSRGSGPIYPFALALILNAE